MISNEIAIVFMYGFTAHEVYNFLVKDFLVLYYWTQSEPDAKIPACNVRVQKLLSILLVLGNSCSKRTVNHKLSVTCWCCLSTTELYSFSFNNLGHVWVLSTATILLHRRVILKIKRSRCARSTLSYCHADLFCTAHKNDNYMQKHSSENRKF